VYSFLDSRHVFILVHVVLDIGLVSLCLSRVQAFSGKVPRVIAVVTLSDLLGLGVTLEGFFHLGNISSEALLVCSIWGKVSSREVHWDRDIVHGSWGV
jgi:hypothetical protein